MKSIVRFSMTNTVAICILIMMLIGGGLYSIGQMKMEKYPQVDIPYLHMTIVYPGASPEQIMRDIGTPLEQKLQNIKGIINLYSGANPNVFFATLQFSMSTNIEQAEKAIRDEVASFKLPDTARAAEYRKETVDTDIYTVAIYGDVQEKVQQVMENSLRPAIRTIEGIDQINVGGAFEKKLYIRLKPDALSAANLTMDDIKQFVTANNLSLPIGDLKTVDQTLPIRINTSLSSIDDVKNIPLLTTVTNPDGTKLPKMIKLGEIADVVFESTESNITRINGEPAVTLTVIPKGGEDAVAIAKQAKAKVAAIPLPEGMKTAVLIDRSTEIEQSVNSMLREVLLGALMAVLVTFLFLRNLRSTLIAVISIPLSMFASIIVLNYLGYTLNMMTLAGIAVAIGRVVDDSIVVMENIFRRVRTSAERNSSLVEEATAEVSSAITSSTITTVAVFLPLAFVPGIVGKFFVPLAWTVVISLLFSLLVAITVVPLMSRLFLLNLKHQEHRENFIQTWYRKALKGALNYRWITLSFAVILLALSCLLIAPKLGFNFLPAEKVQKYNVNIKMPIGTVITKTEAVSGQVEKILQSNEGIELVTASIHNESANLSFAVKDTVKDSNDLALQLREQFKLISGSNGITLVGVGGVGGGSEFSLVINGPNIESIKQAAEQMTTRLKSVENLADVRSTAEGEKPEIAIDLDNQKLAANGLTPADVALTLHNLVQGVNITKTQINGKTADVILLLKADINTSVDVFKMQKILTRMGTQVTLQELGNIRITKNPTQISHFNQAIYLQIYGTITAANTGNVTSAAEKALGELTLPAGVTWNAQGASKELNDGFINMSIAVLLSIFLVYMVMLIAFSDWKLPLVILVAIPFSLIGALIGLYIVQEPIGMPALIGVLMLCGIVVTNAIVLIDRVKTNMDSGMRKYEALMEGGVTRIRPILMTAIATIGALLPLAISTDGGLISRALAVVVIGGLTTSTFLTLIIVPVIFSLVVKQTRTPFIEQQPINE